MREKTFYLKILQFKNRLCKNKSRETYTTRRGEKKTTFQSTIRITLSKHTLFNKKRKVKVPKEKQESKVVKPILYRPTSRKTKIK